MVLDKEQGEDCFPNAEVGQPTGSAGQAKAGGGTTTTPPPSLPLGRQNYMLRMCLH